MVMTRELTDEELKAVVVSALRGQPDSVWRCFTHDSGPYEITRLNASTERVCRAVEAKVLAHLAQRGTSETKAADLPLELRGVAEELAAGSGFWRSCSGCHESNEGHPTGAYSEVFKCHLGLGCRECGGLGAIWDDTDYDDMADFIAQSLAASPQAVQPMPDGGAGLGDGAERRVEAKAAGLRWCRQCGEGTVAGLCRKGLPAGQCPIDAPPVAGVNPVEGTSHG